jgi:glycosyltransferase involved in cell wall biosynthesis
MKYFMQKRNYKKLVKWHVAPFHRADLLLVHNDVTADALAHFGIDKSKIQKFPHPVYVFPEPPKSHQLADELNKKSGDVIYCTVGMMHRYKGVYEAIKALKFLPDNYKLAIIGGVHSLSEDVVVYDKACDLIDQLGLRDRVYITGFVKDDNEMNALIRECEVCVFPYDGKYYGNLSSGSINLAIANHKPVIAYPTSSFKELANNSDGAVVLCDTFAYYELAREIKRIDTKKQSQLSEAYAKKMAWPKMSSELLAKYKELVA